MRFTITPLGSAGGTTVDQVVGRVVRYLNASPAPPPPPGTDKDAPAGPSRYYADSSDEPGEWKGRGATASGLVGQVDPEDFARVLAGRDPHTGGRLITAQGSAGRRPKLGVGAETRRSAVGEALYDERDAATVLGLTQAEVARLIDVGERLAVVRLLEHLTVGGERVPDQPEGSYLVPFVGEDDTRWVTESELSRCEAARSVGPSPHTIALTGDPYDALPLAEAARLAGVTSRYLRSLCRRWEHHGPKIETALAEGRTPRRAYLVAHRGVKGHWRVRRQELVEFLRRRTPPAVRVGYDLTLTTEKSLGVLALLGDGQTRQTVLDAIAAGNDVGLAFLEDHAACARAKGEQVPVRGWTVASFRHLTSRALDPFPHHHNVVANSVVDEDGTLRALDARSLYHKAPEASALATVEMRWRLSHKIGVRWRRRPQGGWEVDGISDEILRKFSQRRGEIDEALAELEAAIGRGSSIAELQGAVLSTRPAKRYVDPDELVDRWWERAGPLELTPHRLAGCLRRVSAAPPEPDPRELFAALAAPTGLCADSSVFTRGDVVAALANLAVPADDGRPQPLLVPATRLSELADEFLASQHVVKLRSPAREEANDKLGREQLYSTREILAVQHEVLGGYRSGLGRAAALAAPEVIEAALVRHPSLSEEQRALVRAFCISGHQVQCAIGRAGSGKTTAMRAAAEAWQAAGFRVVGTAVKGEATRQLALSSGVPTETVAWFLARAWTPANDFDARTVLLVDEASTISDRDLAEILRLAKACGTAVRLIGDPAQHGSVAAGGMFRVLCERHPDQAPELRQSQRVAHAQDRAAAEALRQGRVDEALDLLDAAGHLHLVEGDVEVHVDLLHRWWEERQAGRPHPMVDRRNHIRRALNRLAHRLLQVAGEIGSEEMVAAGGRAFAVGDRVVARRGNRDLYVQGDRSAYVRNGATGRVVGLCRRPLAAEDQITVAFDGIGTVTLPRSFFDEHRFPRSSRVDVGLDHAYAVTSYSVQGATYEASTSRLDEGTSRPEVYVDITRGRSANHVYLSRTLDPFDGEALPKAPPPLLDRAVAARLHRSGPELTAIEIDPEALRRARAFDREPIAR